LVGVPFGLTVIVWGLLTRKGGGRIVAAIGAAGIAMTLALYGALFYFGFVQQGGVYDKLRIQLAQNSLNSLVPAIEFYRIEHGQYPESLAVLHQSLPEGSILSVQDPTLTAGFGQQPKYFFYQRVGDQHYYLRGLGADEAPFTTDDLIPRLSSQGDKTGLLTERRD